MTAPPRPTPKSPSAIGVYVDGYNLYYGGRGICGRGTPGWRWLDVRALATRVIAAHSGWRVAGRLRVVFCTARIKGSQNVQSQHDQDVYLRALALTGAVDLIEYGVYVTRTATAPLATAGPKGRPRLTKAQWPVMVKDGAGSNVSDAWFMASVARREEKGSDVNVATHLLADLFQGRIDGAVVISNDSDLRLPVDLARSRVPVGVVNPTKSYTAGALSGPSTVGGGGHWWCRLDKADFSSCQLPDPAGPKIRRPAGW